MSSGLPNRNPTDADKFRQQYLSTLALQANINAMNLEANKVFLKTGVSPTQVTDGRTTTEKYADIERLKIDVRSRLGEIMDGTDADAAVEIISQRPDDLRFLANNIDPIIKDIKPRYKLGIQADIFINFLDRYIDKYQQTLGVEMGLQQATGEQILLSNQQILNQMITIQDLNALIQQLNGIFQQANFNPRMMSDLRRDIGMLINIIPDEQTIRSISQVENANLRFSIQQDLNEALQNLPTRADIKERLAAITKVLRTKDFAAVNEKLEELHQALAQPPAVLAAIQAAEQNILQELGSSSSAPKANIVNYINPSEIETGQGVRHKITQADLKTYIHLLFGLADEKGEPFGVRETLVVSTREKMKNFLMENDDKIKLLIASIPSSVSAPSSASTISTLTAGGGYSPFSASSIGTTAEDYSRSGVDVPVKDTGEDTFGGTGMKKKRKIKGRGLSTDSSLGVERIQYVPFGRYVLNKQHLHNNKVLLKTPYNKNIPNFPSKLVSEDLSNVLQKIVGKGMPTYDDLNKLSDEERHYLHQLAQVAHINDRLNIPTPNKTEEQKDINRFMILKGELSSGNDNSNLIKEFKILVMKLKNNGLLPKKQATDILCELATLGY